MEKTMIKIQHMAKSFGNIEVLKDINLSLKKGENIVVLGKSGSGKSVLTKCIVGLIKHDSGHIELFDKVISRLEDDELDNLRKNVGYLFQGGALYDSMTLRENLEFPLKRSRFSMDTDRKIEDRIEEVLDNVGLLDAINKMPADLSGGMKKRAGLARTLILRPEIILYDEPTTGLDPVTSGEISELILKLQKKYGTSSIIITHDMKCAKLTANKLKLLQDGVFYAEGTYDELSNSKDPYVNAYFK
jgi:phospholipid/cholesterol/gamma-HCH transport system ATP-binding protein